VSCSHSYSSDHSILCENDDQCCVEVKLMKTCHCCRGIWCMTECWLNTFTLQSKAGCKWVFVGFWLVKKGATDEHRCWEDSRTYDSDVFYVLLSEGLKITNILSCLTEMCPGSLNLLMHFCSAGDEKYYLYFYFEDHRFLYCWNIPHLFFW